MNCKVMPLIAKITELCLLDRGLKLAMGLGYPFFSCFEGVSVIPDHTGWLPCHTAMHPLLL